MLGVGVGLMYNDYVGEEGFTTLGLLVPIAIVNGLNDENVGIILALDSDTVSGLDLASLSDNERVPGLTGNVTVVHTHTSPPTDEDGVPQPDAGALDPPVTQANKTLYAYKAESSSVAVYLANTDASTQSNSKSVDLTASPFSGIAAIGGEQNRYTITVNYLAKSGLTNSASCPPLDRIFYSV